MAKKFKQRQWKAKFLLPLKNGGTKWSNMLEVTQTGPNTFVNISYDGKVKTIFISSKSDRKLYWYKNGDYSRVKRFYEK